jgi:hypothetical protein
MAAALLPSRPTLRATAEPESVEPQFDSALAIEG